MERRGLNGSKSTTISGCYGRSIVLYNSKVFIVVNNVSAFKSSPFAMFYRHLSHWVPSYRYRDETSSNSLD
jgi:hypothetical protein